MLIKEIDMSDKRDFSTNFFNAPFFNCHRIIMLMTNHTIVNRSYNAVHLKKENL